MPLKAVLFDVDFTLIYPGPTFRGEGYQAFCARHGMDVDASKFEVGVASAAPLLNSPDDVYDPEIFIAYTNHIIESMGGSGPGVYACSREIYREWAACQHFEMYDDVPQVLQQLARDGLHSDSQGAFDVVLQAVTDHDRVGRRHIEQLQRRREDARVRLHQAVVRRGDGRADQPLEFEM